jgi:Vam6/Vps39-like protein vacuolar protein sorting-associated protein 39
MFEHYDLSYYAQERRGACIRALYAVSLFSAGNFKDAMKAFIKLDVNPAKVIALYPETVAGRLCTPREKWIELFGGTLPADQSPDLPPAPPVEDTFARSVDALFDYLADRRPKVFGALASLHITQSSSHVTALSAVPTEELFSLPDAPPSALIPEQLVRFAQIVDTALFKSYLLIRPTLLGSLCRLDNWCEVSEVEEVLRERKVISQLNHYLELYIKRQHLNAEIWRAN